MEECGCIHFTNAAVFVEKKLWEETLEQGRSKVVAAFGRKPLNFRIPSGSAATSEQP
jgi:hypothetical protein